MRSFAILAVLAAGCSSGVRQGDFDQHQKEFLEFQKDVNKRNDLAAYTYDQLVNRLDSLGRKVAELEQLLKVMEVNLARLEDRIKSGGFGRVGAPADPGQGEGSVAPPPKRTEEIILEAETALSDLRAGKLGSDKVAEQLKPYAAVAAPYLMEEVRKSITKIEYTMQLESILSKFPVADLKIPLQKALLERGVRVTATRIAGAVGDRELSKILEPYLSTDDEDFRLVAGEALVRCRNAAGIPALVRCLRSDQRDTRLIAINVLKSLSRNEDFGYRPQADAAQNEAALKSWDQWEANFGKTIFD
jgi:hypothetical protein